MTTLVVARPVVLGEDPGLQAEFSDPGGLVLTLLWFAAAVGWAIWRLLAGRSGETGGKGWPPSGAGVVEVALLATVVVVFVSAEVAARYHHPARIIAWEWLGLFVAFFLVRQMIVRPHDQQGLFTALLAGAVALSAHGIYQEFVELPQTRRELVDKPEGLQQALAEQGMFLPPDDPFLELTRRRILDNHLFGTYSHPNSFAGVLALFLPGLVGAAILSWRARRAAWKTALVIGCALLTAAALLLTHSRGAILASVLAGGAAGVVAGWSFARAHRGLILAVLVGLAGAAYAVYATGLWTTGIGKTSGTAAQRLEYWRTAWHIIAGRPWLGVGPGNFGPAYTRNMDENAPEQIKDPHSFVLEMWATSGIFALVGLLTALAAFFFSVVRGAWGVGREEESVPPEKEGPPTLRWEYYAGGVFGLLLGFVLRVGDLPSTAIFPEAYAAGLRSVVWFAAFALLENVPWTRRGRTLALTTGAAALLLNLSVSGGISFPSVAGPLWVVIALALTGAERGARSAEPTASSALRAPRSALALPVFAALALAYLVYVFEPVTSGRALMQKGEAAGRAFLDKVATNPSAVFLAPIKRFKEKVTEPLDEAAREDPDDARIQAVRAAWYGQLFDLELKGGFNPLRALEVAETAVKAAVRAQQLDPGEARGYLSEYQLRLFFAWRLKTAAKNPANKDRKGKMEDDAREQYRLAAQALARHVPDDPSNPIYRYQIALALFDGDDQAGGKAWAEEALALDSRLTRLQRRLTDPQREELRKRLGLAPGS